MSRWTSLIFICFIVASCVTVPPGPPVFAAPDNIDEFGGWEDVKSATPKSLVGNSSDSCGGLILNDTGAFTGKDYSWQALQPDVNDFLYFVIRANNDDQLFVWPSDRLSDPVLTNGDMQLDSDWYDYGAVDTNERSSTQALPWNTYSRHVVGSADGEGIYQNGLQFDLLENDCSTAHTYLWNGAYLTYAYILIESGTPWMQIVESDGTTVEVSMAAGDDSVTGKWQDFRTGRNEQFSNPTFSSVTIDSGADTLTDVAHGLSDNDQVVFRATSMPTGLSTCSPYFVINKTDDTFQISETRGGSAFDFSDTGTAVEWGGTGEIRFYCSGGPCEFYLGTANASEYDFNNYIYNYPDLNEVPSGNYTTTVNSGTDEYRILAPWRIEYFPAMDHWAMVDPLDNFFKIKGLNNYNPNYSDGVDFDGNDFNDNWNAHPKVAGLSAGASLFAYGDRLQEIGFNTIVGNINQYDVNDKWQPMRYAIWNYIGQTRVQAYNFTDVGELKFGMTTPDSRTMEGKWPDVFDADWESKFTSVEANTVFNAPGGWGIYYHNGTFRQLDGVNSNQFDISPYYDGSLNTIANPRLIGWDLDEEPPGMSSYNIMGYMIGRSPPDANGTTSTDNVNDTKMFYVNYLRSYYTDGGEADFVTNISEDGSDMITPYTSWSGVTGYVSSAKDDAALANMNSDCGTTYTSWEAVAYEDGDDSADVWSSGKDENAGFEAVLVAATGQCEYVTNSYRCAWNDGEATVPLQNRLDEIHAAYGRRWNRYFYEHIFGPDGFLHGQKINFGPGFGAYYGWKHGMIDKTETTPYVDVLSSGSWGGEGGIYRNDHPTIGNRVSSWNTFLGLPSFIETGWVTGESDSSFSFRNTDGTSRTIDAVYKLTDTDYAVYLSQRNQSGWDCDTGVYAGIASYCSESVDTYRFDNDEVIYWNCSDPLDVPGTCADSGTAFWHFIKNVDQPFSHARFFNKYIIIADSGSIGNLANNDLITNGTDKMFTVRSDTVPPFRASMIVSAGANFNTNYNNPNALDQVYGMYSLVDEDDPSPRRYYHIAHGFATERSLICWKEATAYPSETWLGPTGSGYVGFRDVNVGDHFRLNYLGLDGTWPWEDVWYELDTQEARADMFVNFWQQIFDSSFRDTNGDNLLIGSTFFGVIDDGFCEQGSGDYLSTSQGQEFRQFGFISQKGNFYDAVEATQLGWDGLPGTNDDEAADYGDFVGGVQDYFSTFYQSLAPGAVSSGTYRIKAKNAIFKGIRM